MNSLILRTATRFILTLLLLFALFLLSRGHDEPGGGFIGGLIAAGAFALHAIAFGVKATRRATRVDPRWLIGSGLALAVFAGLVPALVNRPFLTGLWPEVELGRAEVTLGSPILFDVGVFLVVMGMTLTIILALEEE